MVLSVYGSYMEDMKKYNGSKQFDVECQKCGFGSHKVFPRETTFPTLAVCDNCGGKGEEKRWHHGVTNPLQ